MANVLICLSASKYNSRVIDKGAQIAKSNHAVLSAIFVQTPKYEGASAASKSCLRENIKYVESKGAKVTILYGQDVLPQLVEYVGVSQVDCVVLEKNLAKQALFKLKDIDIYSVNLFMCDKEAIEVQKILPFLSDTWPLCRIGRALGFGQINLADKAVINLNVLPAGAVLIIAALMHHNFLDHFPQEKIGRAHV